MVQGIRSVGATALAISKVERRDGSSAAPARTPSSDTPVDFMAELSRENQAAASSRLEDVKSAVESAGTVGRGIEGDRATALSAHSRLTPERVADLLKD